MIIDGYVNGCDLLCHVDNGYPIVLAYGCRVVSEPKKWIDDQGRLRVTLEVEISDDGTDRG